MALEATHVRFALDMKDKYQVSDVKKYVAGAVYPDSRYVAKVDRRLTHPEDFEIWNVAALDDFRKGWYSHLLYDKLQGQVVGELFPSINSLPNHQHGTEWWLKFTAIKILQDMDDLGKFEIGMYLPMLDYAENPCGENIEKVKEFNHIFQTLYANPSLVTIESYRPVWEALSLDDVSISKLKSLAEEYSASEDSKKLVKRIYKETLLNARR